MKRKINKGIFRKFLLFCLILVLPLFSIGCTFSETPETNCIINIEKSRTEGNIDYYKITYLDGTTSELTITNGTNGTNGSNGANGTNVSINDVFQKYHEEVDSNISYADFLELYLNLSTNDNSKVINSCLRSCLKIYTEFKVTTQQLVQVQDGYWSHLDYQYVKSKSVMCGSGVIYKIESDYTYVLTNYHVVYSQSVNEDNGSNIASLINGYLYGSESSPYDSETTDSEGYKIYDYGAYGIPFEYVGGSIDYDLAMLKVPTATIKAINSDIKAVEFADNYYVGETAIAIGNPENEGISATQGIVNVDNEYIQLQIDSTTRSYRSIRIDTAIYGGSSGGGLFNSYGKLIGITNAGDNTDENINYAIPIEVIKSVTDNIMYYYDGTNPTSVKKVTLGVSVTSDNSKYVYNQTTGYGRIEENVVVQSIVTDSIAETLAITVNDTLKSITINGVETNIVRKFNIGDILLSVREDDVISIKYVRNGVSYQTDNYTILAADVK